MITIETITGRQLSDAIIERMSNQRIVEYGENTKDFRKYEQESIFFFVRDEAQLCAFGMLKPLTLTYGDSSTDMLGIGNIIAIEKGQDYGRELMHSIQAYLMSKNQIGMGFCAPRVAGFYQRCGYQIVENLSARYRYSYAHQDGKREQLEHAPNILCFDPNNAIIKTLLTSDDLIYVNVPFW